MILDPSPEQTYFRETTARFLEDRAPVSHLRNLRDDPIGFDRDYWSAGTELGWTSLTVDEEFGGGSVSDDGIVDLCLVAHEFGRHAAPGPLVDCNVAASALAGLEGDLHRAALADLLSGESTVSCCMGAALWDLGSGVHIDIRRDGDDIVINGFARPADSPVKAKYLLVTGYTDTGMSQALVPCSIPGITVKPLKSVDVARRFAAITFEDVRVPAAYALGDIGGAKAQIRRQALLAGVMLAAEAVGSMEAAFDLTLQWAFDRYTFGRPLASYQALKHRFADMKTWLEASHAISDLAAAELSAGTDRAAELVSAARAYVGHYGVELAQDCVQLHGGIGVTYEHDLHFLLRRVTLNRVLYGSPADHHKFLAKSEIHRESNA